MRTRAVVVLVAIVAALIAALIRLTRDDARGDALVAGARFPAALAPLDDGGLLYGERLSGRIREVRPSGDLVGQPIATVDVSTDGQRGLLGVAVDDSDRVFAAWTRPDLRLVVGQVAPGQTRLVWLGPETTDVANGGHLAFAPNGRLVIGIGDLTEPELVTDPSTPNGKLLALDPDGSPEQQPDVVSTGWNNPFAFTFSPGGELWVADNSPGGRPERIARGDQRDPVVTELQSESAPSGLAAVSDRRLLMCGFVSRTLQPFVVGPDGTASADGDPLAEDCALGVAVLAEGHLVYSNEEEIRVLQFD